MEQRKYIPAFPTAKITVLAEDGQQPESSSLEWPGMTLLDYFAANAMQGMLAAPMGKFTHATYEEAADDAYAMADAMLTAREK